MGYRGLYTYMYLHGNRNHDMDTYLTLYGRKEGGERKWVRGNCLRGEVRRLPPNNRIMSSVMQGNNIMFRRRKSGNWKIYWHGMSSEKVCVCTCECECVCRNWAKGLSRQLKNLCMHVGLNSYYYLTYIEGTVHHITVRFEIVIDMTNIYICWYLDS